MDGAGLACSCSCSAVLPLWALAYTLYAEPAGLRCRRKAPLLHQAAALGALSRGGCGSLQTAVHFSVAVVVATDSDSVVESSGIARCWLPEGQHLLQPHTACERLHTGTWQGPLSSRACAAYSCFLAGSEEQRGCAWAGCSWSQPASQQTSALLHEHVLHEVEITTQAAGLPACWCQLLSCTNTVPRARCFVLPCLTPPFCPLPLPCRNHRGLRHYWGLTVRGQHTKTTGRRGKTVGVTKKK